jgi:hypothetical protein
VIIDKHSSGGYGPLNFNEKFKMTKVQPDESLKQGRNSRMRIIVIVLFLMVAPLAQANGIQYTFSGANGLSGQFILDDAAQFYPTTPTDTIRMSLSSPLHYISGNYGAYFFEGAPVLEISDAPATNDVTQDYWIIRAGQQSLAPNSTLSGPAVNGVSVVLLNLFVYTGPSALNGYTLTPPSPFFQFDYIVKLSNGTIQSGALHTLTQVPVPEPSTLLLLLSGLCGLAWAISRKMIGVPSMTPGAR